MARYEGTPPPKWWEESPEPTPGYTVSPSYRPPETHESVLTLRDHYLNWFVRPLENFEGQDVFVCIMTMLPLIEKYARWKVSSKVKNDFGPIQPRSPQSFAMAHFLSVPEPVAFAFWSAFRNGLLHRAVVKNARDYIIHPDRMNSKPLELIGEVLHIYVWVLRDGVVASLKNASPKLWTQDQFPLPRVVYPNAQD